MGRMCDVCGTKIGFSKFRYQEGYVCKSCYQKASRNFTETITQKSKAEIMELCRAEQNQTEDYGEFQRTGKIGNYILIDENNHSFCITHNRMIEKERKKAEVISFGDVKRIELMSDPVKSREELAEMSQKRKDAVVKKLEILVYTYSKKEPARIVILASAARTSSFAFRKSFEFAEKILDKLEEMRKNVEDSKNVSPQE